MQRARSISAATWGCARGSSCSSTEAASSSSKLSRSASNVTRSRARLM